MNNKPKVSIICTSYNHEKYLEDVINATINQSYNDFELIIWDDRSTDRSWEIIQSFDDDRIRAFRNDENQHYVATFLNAVGEAKGDYIAIQHSDTIWQKDKLLTQVNYLNRHPNVGAVFSLADIIDDDSNLIKNENHYYFKVFDQPNRNRYEWLNYFFYKGNALCEPSVLIRKESNDAIRYRYGLAQLPDLDRWVRLCLKHEIHIVQKKLVKFRVEINHSNMSGNRPDNRIRSQVEFFQILDHFKSIPNTKELLKIFPDAESFISGERADPKFLLGMTAVETGINYPTKLFGLNLLFESLNDPDHAEILKKYHHFDYKAFIKLTSKYDIFFVEAANIQQLSKSSQEYSLLNLRNQLEECQKEILYYSMSSSWKMTRPFRKLMQFIKKS